MLRSNTIYQWLIIIPTLWFFIPTFLATALFLFWRGQKPAASTIVALSAPGAASAIIMFFLIILYKFQTSAISMHFNTVIALFAVVAFPSHVICPLAFIFSIRRYVSENRDYTIGVRYILSLLAILASILISHLLVTSPNYVM
jgi:hypothetical protein